MIPLCWCRRRDLNPHERSSLVPETSASAIPPLLQILNLWLYSTASLWKKLCGKDTCGAQNRLSLLLVANDFDRYAISHLLYPPQAACVLNAASSATPAYLIVVLNCFVEKKALWEGHLRIKCKMQNAKWKIKGTLRVDYNSNAVPKFAICHLQFAIILPFINFLVNKYLVESKVNRHNLTAVFT